MFERLPGAEIGGEGDRTEEFRGADRLLDPSGQGRSSRPVFRRHRVDPTPSREKPSLVWKLGLTPEAADYPKGSEATPNIPGNREVGSPWTNVEQVRSGGQPRTNGWSTRRGAAPLKLSTADSSGNRS